MLPVCPLVHRRPAVTRCNILSELPRSRAELRDVSASGDAASSGGGSDDPGPRRQQRNAPWSLVFHIFHHSFSTHTHTPTPFLLFYTPLLVCCALLFPLLLLITYTELNKGARKNVEWIRRRFTSQQGSAGGWGVCSLLPHHLQLGEYSNVSQGFPQCTGDLLRLEM